AEAPRRGGRSPEAPDRGTARAMPLTDRSERTLPRHFHLVAALLGIATAVIATWPVTAHLSDQLIDGAMLTDPPRPEGCPAGNIGADVFTTVWIVNWVLHALATNPLHLFDANIFHPAPLALARSEHLIGLAPLALPGALVGGPVVAHQTALIACFALNVWL